MLLRKIILGMIASSWVLIPNSHAHASVDQEKSHPKTVFITKTGEKFHRKNCKHLRYSSIPIEIEEARRLGYDACKVCAP